MPSALCLLPISKKNPASATWQGSRMKFLKLLQEKAMAETMRANKVTIKTNTPQYHFVVVLKPLADLYFLLQL
jgi:hypothetical protein